MLLDMYGLWAAVTALVLTIVLSIAHGVERRLRRPNLPPGSMGWMPLVGETLQYCKESPSVTGGVFLSQRIQRYGKLFRSHLFGEPVVISTDAKLNRFLLQKEGVLVKSSYPKPILNILGAHNTTGLHGETHRIVRNAVLNVLRVAIGRDETLQFLSEIVLHKLHQWNGRIVKFQDEASHMSFSMVLRQLLGYTVNHPNAEFLYENYQILMDGFLRLPISFPGTAYNRAIKTKRKVMRFLEEIINEREGDADRGIVDVLDGLLAVHRSKPSAVTRDVVVDVMIGLIFAGYETTSRIITVGLKLMMDQPHIVKALQQEHYSIMDKIEGNVKHLTWEHYKSMTFTHKVVKELLRLVNAGELVFRETMKDVELDGYIIPKGWKMMLSFIPANVDPANFPNPLDLNPWRWKDNECDEEQFIAFGGGPRQCLGKDFARLEISIFIHHLVTKYRWKQVEEDEVVRGSRGARFEKGLALHFQKIGQESQVKI